VVVVVVEDCLGWDERYGSEVIEANLMQAEKIWRKFQPCEDSYQWR